MFFIVVLLRFYHYGVAILHSALIIALQIKIVNIIRFIYNGLEDTFLQNALTENTI